MLHIVLWEPEIPPNTGNIARLCAATGTRLHLVGRLGFRLDEKSLRRAGCDYWPAVDVIQHITWQDFTNHFSGRLWIVDNPAPRHYTQVSYMDGDALIFGNEGHGLPAEIRNAHADRLIDIPMPTGKVRSINLATAAGIVLYEALRQVEGW